jgi:hypothetical protein
LLQRSERGPRLSRYILPKESNVSLGASIDRAATPEVGKEAVRLVWEMGFLTESTRGGPRVPEGLEDLRALDEYLNSEAVIQSQVGPERPLSDWRFEYQSRGQYAIWTSPFKAFEFKITVRLWMGRDLSITAEARRSTRYSLLGSVRLQYVLKGAYYVPAQVGIDRGLDPQHTIPLRAFKMIATVMNRLPRKKVRGRELTSIDLMNTPQNWMGQNFREGFMLLRFAEVGPRPRFRPMN